MSWEGESIRHSLAARGVKIRNTPRWKMHDVKGLEALESRLKDSGTAVPGSIEFYDWEIVLDTSRFGEPATEKQHAVAFIGR